VWLTQEKVLTFSIFFCIFAIIGVWIWVALKVWFSGGGF